jgi:hypothetical protein
VRASASYDNRTAYEPHLLPRPRNRTIQSRIRLKRSGTICQPLPHIPEDAVPQGWPRQLSVSTLQIRVGSWRSIPREDGGDPGASRNGRPPARPCLRVPPHLHRPCAEGDHLPTEQEITKRRTVFDGCRLLGGGSRPLAHVSVHGMAVGSGWHWMTLSPSTSRRRSIPSSSSGSRLATTLPTRGADARALVSNTST